MTDKSQDLFDSDTLFNEAESNSTAKGPVVCLGKTFANDDERRAFFREELRGKLPELKKIEGFPIGEDDDVINLSDPPYYTACPNPWLDDFVKEWEEEKKALEAKKLRKATFEVHAPYASDVSEGKNNPIYNAHSYHTKVPHPAIMRYILHYTQPGDIVLDGFAGTGMTGVAAQMCGNPDPDLKFKIENEFTANGLEKPVWGARKAICGDLSPIASFIAYNYNTPVDVQQFEREAKRILAEVEKECGWMYETQHSDGSIGRINYTVWSDVFICPNCGKEIIFWEAAVDKEKGEVRDEFACPDCKAMHVKRGLEKAMVTVYDQALKETIRQAKTVPVLINYTANGKRHEKTPDKADLALIAKIDASEIPYWYPTDPMMGKGAKWGDTWRAGYHEGITHVHHFYTKRVLFIFSVMKNKFHGKLNWLLSSIVEGNSKLNRERPFGLPSKLSGTLYVSSMIREIDAISFAKRKIETYKRAIIRLDTGNSSLGVNSAATWNVTNNTIDYIFTDPPFGGNLMYSELNFIGESWLKIKTNNKEEAIENSSQHKTLFDYQEIMQRCFGEYYRILKPGKWMTVEFSNTGAAVWNGIQTSIQQAGFVIANVAALDKQQGSFKAVTSPTAVKQDLVISCYKPSSEFDEKFRVQSADVNIWTFIEEHLEHLPVSIIKDKITTAVIERSPKILYDRMLTFFLMRNLRIPLDAGEFQEGLRNRFKMEDSMVFTSTQLTEYQAQKKKLGIETNQLKLAFDIIYTENDAVQWIKEKLETEHLKYNELMPAFRKANTATRKGEKEFELKTILEENFIELADGSWRVPDPNEAKDRELLRTKALLKEFDHYLVELGNGKVKKLKDVRLEALRAGFKNSWEKKDWGNIVNIADKIPQNLLMEDEQLLMYYDIAKDRM